MPDNELFQKLSENERELALLREDMKTIKEQRDRLQQELTACRSELEEKNSAAIVSGAAWNDLEEKLKMSEYQNGQLKKENELLKRELWQAKQTVTVENKSVNAAPIDEDNPYEYRSPYTRQALFDSKFFSGGIRFEDYDFGKIKVGQPAAIAGRVEYNNGEPKFVPDEINMWRMCSRAPKIGGFEYIYAGIDKVKKVAMVKFSGMTGMNNDRGIGYADGTCEVPLTHCFNISEIDRWYSDWSGDEQEQQQTEKSKRGLFRKR